jgi:hypothetical protein
MQPEIGDHKDKQGEQKREDERLSGVGPHRSVSKTPLAVRFKVGGSDDCLHTNRRRGDYFVRRDNPWCSFIRTN